MTYNRIRNRRISSSHIVRTIGNSVRMSGAWEYKKQQRVVRINPLAVVCFPFVHLLLGNLLASEPSEEDCAS